MICKNIGHDISKLGAGNSRWVNAMEWSGKTNFGEAEEVPFVVDGKEAGSLKSYEQLSFLKVGLSYMINNNSLSVFCWFSHSNNNKGF